jgi:hypothetical protein
VRSPARSFLKENEFPVGISIDGPQEIHDTYRVSKGGKPTFDRVIRGLDALEGYEVDWNVLTTLHAANGDHGRLVYRFLRDSGWGRHVKGRPLYTQRGELVTHRSIGPEQYGRFMIDVFEEWVRRDIGWVYVQMFDTALANFCGEQAGICGPSPQRPDLGEQERAGDDIEDRDPRRGVRELLEEAAASPSTKAAATPMISVAPNAPRKNHLGQRLPDWTRRGGSGQAPLPSAIFCWASARAPFRAWTWLPSASPMAFSTARVTAGSTFAASVCE